MSSIAACPYCSSRDLSPVHPVRETGPLYECGRCRLRFGLPGPAAKTTKTTKKPKS